MMIFQTFKVFETWVVLIINELDYPSFENFESRRILSQLEESGVKELYLSKFYGITINSGQLLLLKKMKND